jgi:hypothetical protein
MHESPSELQADCVFFVRIEPFSSWRSHSVGFCDSGVQFLHQFRQPKKTGGNETKATKNARSKKKPFVTAVTCTNWRQI